MIKWVLIGPQVRKKPAILTEFLRGLSELHLEGLDVEFLLLDDNVIEESSDLLRRFQVAHSRAVIQTAHSADTFVCDEEKHHWTVDLIWKVAAIKDRIIAQVLRQDCVMLFFLCSDLVMAPVLLRPLVALDKPVVSEVFWTSWIPDTQVLPSVWLRDLYGMYRKERGETLTEEEGAARSLAFVKMMRRPGVYRVGGLCGCTLISREALAKGVCFSEIDNISLWGEDRHLCVRARALGVELWADTRYPPLHIYREKDLARIPTYRARFEADYLTNTKLTLSMIVHNQASRWLRDALRAHRPLINDAVIIDDASTDGTVDLIRRELAGIPVRLVRNPVSPFANEVVLRHQQSEESLPGHPDWLLVMDAAEILEPAAASAIPTFLPQP